MTGGRRLRRLRRPRPLATAAALVLAACAEEAPEVAPEPPAYSRPTPDYARAEDAPSPPAVTFTESAAASGLAFRHETGAFGDKWMPETMGSGCALHDLDGDGDDDALLVNGAWWPGHEGQGPAPTSALFANDGTGSFTDVTAGSGVDVSVYGMGVTAADYDADGDADLYLTTLGDNLLLRQDRPLRFTDAAARAGVAGETWTDGEGRRHPEWSTGAAWADVDGDGRPDLLVTNYVHWSPENDLYASFDGKNKSYATPQQYTGSTPRLYRNRGDGGFSDITAEAGLLLPHAKSMGVAADDFDADGRVDLVITNDTQPNFLLRNLGGGRFEEVGTAAGIGYDESGRARAGMGVDVADLSGDGVLAIGIGNFSREAVSLYRQTAAGGTVFLDGAGKSRLVQPTLPTLTFGLRFFDYDLDGRQDLILANGHIEPEINAVQREIAYAQPPQLFWNDGRGRLLDASARAGPALAEPLVGRGLAVGDVESDGDLDVLITTNGGAPRLLRNDLEGGKALVLRLRGEEGADPLGAVVTVRAGGRTQSLRLRTGSSYLSQSARELTFGLGAAAAAEAVTVRWPDGAVAELGGLEAGAYVVEATEKSPTSLQAAEAGQ